MAAPSGMRRIAALVIAVAVATGAMLGLGAAPASAATVVLVSSDGVSYSPNLNVGLFDGVGLLVPGDSASQQLWIKNPTANPATVRVSVGAITTSDVELGDNMTFSALDTASNQTVTRKWSDLALCDVMVQPETIAGGAVLHVSFTLTMLDATGVQAQHQNASFDAVVAMRDAAGGGFPISTCDPGTIDPGTTDPGTTAPAGTTPTHHSGFHFPLAFTGQDFPTEILMLAGILIGVGWFLLALRRRRREREGES